MQRRERNRAHLFFPVLVQAEGSDRIFEFCGTNFSSGGIFLLMKNPPAVGGTLRLEFDLSPLGGKLEVDATVVRSVTGEDEPDSGKWGAGLKFTSLTEEDELAVREWVLKVAPMKDGPGPAPGGGVIGDEEAPEAARVEVRIRLDGFNYLTKHQNVRMTPAGLFIGTEAPLPTGSRVELELQPIGEDTIYKAKGQVMAIATPRPGDDSSDPGMSIRVIGATEETRKYLQELRAAGE